MKRMSTAMVLCAGYGTRLRPLTDEVPKPLVPIGDRPLLAHIAERLAAAGFTKIVINVHHISDSFCNIFEDLSIKSHVIHEPEILGTAGGIANARALLGPAPILVWNGDILGDPPVDALLAAAKAKGGLVLAARPMPVASGTVGVGNDDAVVRLRGQQFGVETSGGDYIGVAALGERALAVLPANGCLIGDVALPGLARKERVGVVWTSAAFSDIGDLVSYHAANLAWLRGAVVDSYVAEGARVDAGVSLSRCIIGAGANVVGSGALERCVVWPGATVRAPLRDAIVTASGRVVPVARSASPS